MLSGPHRISKFSHYAHLRRHSILALGLLTSFAFGFGLALFYRSKAKIPERATATVTDFGVFLPEGKTTITVYDRQSNFRQLFQLSMDRQGNNVNGIPVAERQIAARIHLSEDDKNFFRRELAGTAANLSSEFLRANAIREWLATRAHRLALPGLATRRPREAYEQMRSGMPVLCGNLADIYVGLCDAAGLKARTVGMSLLVREGRFGADTHVGAEVWSSEKGGWIYEDPTFNCAWEVNGFPVSALQAHDALMTGAVLKLAEQTASNLHAVEQYYVDPRLFFRHLYYEYRPGGALLYYVDRKLEPIRLVDRGWIQTDDRNDIESLDLDGNKINQKYSEVQPGIFVQLINNELFIRDRRESSGLRVRSSTGVVSACAYEHKRAEELGIFDAPNLALNGSFRSTKSSESVADAWSVDGPINAMSVLGGQGISAGNGGRLWQRLRLKPHGSYLLYARLSINRGTVRWSLNDGLASKGSADSVSPGTMKEIVSDVVTTDTGDLELSFCVPDGGAFRVLDVIVNEVPRARL